MEYDLYLHKHIEELCSQIREKAIVQYTIPFTSVVLQNMALAFNSDVDSLEQEIASLIAKGQIHARVDSYAKILNKRHANHNTSNVVQTGKEYERHAKAILLRAKLLQANIKVSPM